MVKMAVFSCLLVQFSYRYYNDLYLSAHYLFTSLRIQLIPPVGVISKSIERRINLFSVIYIIISCFYTFWHNLVVLTTNIQGHKSFITFRTNFQNLLFYLTIISSIGIYSLGDTLLLSLLHIRIPFFWICI